MDTEQPTKIEQGSKKEKETRRQEMDAWAQFLYSLYQKQKQQVEKRRV